MASSTIKWYKCALTGPSIFRRAGPRTDVEVIAHRGFAATGVENAPSTLVSADGLADAVEFDVRLSGDGEPVVVHDELVDRLTNRAGRVDSNPVAELTAMCLAGTDETIPRLEAVLDRLQGPIVPELKVTTVSERLVALLDRYEERVLVASFWPDALRALPERFDRALLVAPDDEKVDVPGDPPVGIESGLAVARDVDAVAIHPHHSLCTAETVAAAHDAGLAVNAWTVRSREEAARLRRLGVDGVIVDDPAVCRPKE